MYTVVLTTCDVSAPAAFSSATMFSMTRIVWAVMSPGTT